MLLVVPPPASAAPSGTLQDPPVFVSPKGNHLSYSEPWRFRIAPYPRATTVVWDAMYWNGATYERSTSRCKVRKNGSACWVYVAPKRHDFEFTKQPLQVWCYVHIGPRKIALGVRKAWVG
jgi:hypothetical protein